MVLSPGFRDQDPSDRQPLKLALVGISHVYMIQILPLAC